MFGTSQCLNIFGIVALQTTNESNPHLRRQKWVFAVGFLAAAPARVADEVDVGSVETDALVHHGVPVVCASVVIEVGAGFGGDDVRLLVDQRRVPRCRHADDLREDRGDAIARDHAMNTFISITVSRDAQARDGCGVREQL